MESSTAIMLILCAAFVVWLRFNQEKTSGIGRFCAKFGFETRMFRPVTGVIQGYPIEISSISVEMRTTTRIHLPLRGGVPSGLYVSSRDMLGLPQNSFWSWESGPEVNVPHVEFSKNAIAYSKDPASAGLYLTEQRCASIGRIFAVEGIFIKNSALHYSGSGRPKSEEEIEALVLGMIGFARELES